MLKYWEIGEYNHSFWDFYFHFGCGEAEDTINLEDLSSDYEQSAAEKLAVLANCEAAKASKTDTNLEKNICDQCNGTNSSENGLTQHMRLKQCPSVDFRY